jgi:hypothetical protein
VELGLSLPSRRAAVLDRAMAWRLALGAVVVASAVVRTWAAWQRATPLYFPDEGIYASLSRSLAHGQLPSVRGHVAHFPALLQPLLTAPAWWFGSLETGYRVTQLIQAVAISTAALVVWLAARRLGVGRGTALAAAALTVAVPDVGYSGWVLAEAFAYPLFIAAVAAGAVALAQPTRRSQSFFLGLALLATFARMQLAVLLLAYLAAAVVLRRVRAQRVVVGGLAVAVVIGLAGGLGYYRQAPTSFRLVGPEVLGRNLLVLAYAAGWIVVPAALLGLYAAWRKPSSAEERAFGVFATFAGIAVVAEATLYGDPAMAHERYGMYALPLLFLGFALHAARGWPWRRPHALLAALMFLAAPTFPLAGWDASHSLVLTGLLKVQQLAGSAGAGGLLVAAAASTLSLLAIASAWRRLTAVVAVLGVAFCVAASGFATSFDVQNSRNVEAAFLPAGPDWVRGDATVVSAGGRTSTLEQFFWNEDVSRLALLPGVPAPDVFTASRTFIRNGRLDGVHGQVVLDENGVAYVPERPLRMNGAWLSAATPRIVAVLEGRGGDGWLPPAGRGELLRGGALSFDVVAPESMTLTIAGMKLHLRAHATKHVRVCSKSFAYAFSAHGYVGMRAVSAQTTFPVWSAGRCL